MDVPEIDIAGQQACVLVQGDDGVIYALVPLQDLEEMQAILHEVYVQQEMGKLE